MADLLDQLRALHSPQRIYGSCTHLYEDAHLTVCLEDGEWTCEESYQYDVCGHCCTDSAGQNDHCIENHKHGQALPICATRDIFDTQPAEQLLGAEGAGPLLDPDCQCGSCVGAPCEHSCHRAATSAGTVDETRG